MVASTFDLFKIGVGPSSSHTMGPMTAAADFADRLSGGGLLPRVARIDAALYGSLALTGKGHASDRAVLLGLHHGEPNRRQQQKQRRAERGHIGCCRRQAASQNLNSHRGRPPHTRGNVSQFQSSRNRWRPNWRTHSRRRILSTSKFPHQPDMKSAFTRAGS